MQPLSNWSFDPPSSLPAPVVSSPSLPFGGVEDSETLMGLINRCVDALHLMQDRMAGLEDHAQRTSDAIDLSTAQMRAEIELLQSRLSEFANGASPSMTEVVGAEAPPALPVPRMTEEATFEADLPAAEESDAVWRERAEAEFARIDAIEDRLVVVETGLEQRLEKTESELAAADATVASLRLRAEEGKAEARGLEQKLAEATKAIAEQRARIACLQAKLSAASDAMTFHEGSAALQARDVIDLAVLTEDRRTSAA